MIKKKTETKAESKGPAKLDDFIKADALKMEGMTPVFVQENKYYLGIPDSLTGRDILMVTRMSETPEGFRLIFSDIPEIRLTTESSDLKKDRTTVFSLPK
jgi:hypothetical protein